MGGVEQAQYKTTRRRKFFCLDSWHISFLCAFNDSMQHMQSSFYRCHLKGHTGFAGFAEHRATCHASQ